MSKIRFILRLVLTLIVCLSCFLAEAQSLRLSSMFSDHMVLQRNAEVNIWGWAREYSQVEITTSWMGDTVKTVASSNGKWIAKINTDSRTGEQSLRVFSAGEQIELTDILLGEVWLASGQSNMAFKMKKHLNSGAYLESGGNDKIRLFNIDPDTINHVLSDFKNTRWEISTKSSISNFSAVAWFFAIQLQQELNVPIGVISTAYGGSTIEAWINEDSLVANDDLVYLVKAPPNKKTE